MYNKSLDLALIGPITKNKMRIIDDLSLINLSSILSNMEDRGIYELNHFKIYSFSKGYRKEVFSDIESKFYSEEEIQVILKELNRIDLEDAFQKINSYEFIERVEKIYIDLSLNPQIEVNNIYNKIVIYENRGFIEGEGLSKTYSSEKIPVDRYIFNAYDYTNHAKDFKNFLVSVGSFKDHFIWKENKKRLNNIVLNARENLMENIKDYLFGYVIL